MNAGVRLGFPFWCYATPTFALLLQGRLRKVWYVTYVRVSSASDVNVSVLLPSSRDATAYLSRPRDTGLLLLLTSQPLWSHTPLQAILTSQTSHVKTQERLSISRNALSGSRSKTRENEVAPCSCERSAYAHRIQKRAHSHPQALRPRSCRIVL